MMVRFTLAAMMVLPSLAWCDDVSRPSSEELSRQMLAAVNVIAEHQVAAPVKQELVRQAIVAVCRAAHVDPPLGLGRELSGITREDELYALVKQEWEQLLSSPDAELPDEQAMTLLAQGIAAMLMTAPGRNSLSEAEEHRVDRQLAANRYVGTGIQLAGAHDGKPPVMVKVFPGGPAHGAGAIDGDKILEIDRIPTEGVPLAEIVRLLRGPDGSDIEVLLQQNDDEPRRYTITRGVVPIQHTQVERKTLGEVSVDVIRFDRLTSATVSDLRKIEQDWETPPAAILLDLQISEFDLHQAVLLADALLDGGKIGRLETATEAREFEASRGALFGGVPLFVLISGATAGTTEWVAAALQDNGRATLIGQQTPGQPYVSEAFDVPGTDWVLTLASGILRRGDGRRLLRTSARPGLPIPAAVARSLEGAKYLKSQQRRNHDGGVIPVRIVTPRGERAQPTPAGMAAPITIEEALAAIRPLLDAGSEVSEAE